MVYVAILGAGTVGSGVYDALITNAAKIAEKSLTKLRVKYVVDIRDIPGAAFEDLLIKDFAVVEKDTDVSIVVETIGGAGVAYDFTKRALFAGKHVVTSNKELVATHGCELLEIANKMNVNYMFEASVGGGVPVIRPLIQCLSANEILEISGILNGTTNYILTRMIHAGITLADALSEAQTLGYAEQNPAADVEGIDAGRKISILASLACGRHIPPDLIHCEGITGITSEDVALAERAGMVIKLLGRFVALDGGRVAAYVAPHLIEKGHILAGVSDVYNGIDVRGNLVGEVLFFGRGAGKEPTASAVAADVIDAARHINKTKNRELFVDGGTAFIGDRRELSTRWYVRSDGGTKLVQSVFTGAAKLTYGAFVTPSMTGFEFERLMEQFKAYALVFSAFRVLGGAL